MAQKRKTRESRAAQPPEAEETSVRELEEDPSSSEDSTDLDLEAAAQAEAAAERELSAISC